MNKTKLIISECITAIFDISEIVEEIVIPDSVTFIGCYAFYGYLSLKSITIPNSVTDIDHGAFYNCLSLNSIYIDKEKYTLDLSDTGIPESCEVYWRGEF